MYVYTLYFALEQVLSDTGVEDRWFLLSWQSTQVRMCGVSCPKVQEGGAVGCLLSAVPMGSGFLLLLRGTLEGEGHKEEEEKRGMNAEKRRRKTSKL